MLEHYVAGRWSTPTDEGLPLHDAATGEEVARLSTAPVPAAEALRHAREVGGPALRAMTLHERAAAVKALALHLKETARNELYELSYATGSTGRDTAVDVDGGIGTALGIASKARRELPDGHVALDGPVEQLGRTGTFLGRHVLTPLKGAAVQVNAYNFPVWGVLEKLAPALVGGMPSVVKPAPQTAYLSALLVRRIIESGLLPEGSVQLLVGDPEGLLDELDGQDVLAFTGSAATAARLRAHPAVVQRSVRFTAEADSLNACVLGPDAGAAELDLFVREVAREMTAKAGQKCTAVRRALVPRQRAEEVGEALRARLEQVVVGDPRDPATRMGALVSLQQRESVREGVARLAAGGRLLVGDPHQPFERGAFLPPLLVAHDDPRTPAPHEVEAFGPVSTLLPYDDAADVVPLLALGRGSLVASVVSSDHDFVRDVVRGAASHHGRVLVLEEADAAESTGHGSPLPQLVHGGPGRAGGGEELGGVRGVVHHMQRTAVQGTPDVLTGVTGVWTRGGSRHEDDVHPFRKTMEQLRLGDCVRTAEREVTREDVEHFAQFTGDTFYAHTDEQAAAANPLFGGIVAHGYLVLSLAAGLFVDPAPGPVLANTGLDRLRFTKPVKPGDRIRVVLTCMAKTPRTPDQGEVRWDVQVLDQADDVVATYELLTMVRAR
ncbi:MAG TPA: phenylacetic acid degradation bifunctional protein PaaZ [Mycobacteriales bacterium]|nr:phenylacetic acid degradation bifunctional protein PaaZ [Mycobacteriales bacterium]